MMSQVKLTDYELKFKVASARKKNNKGPYVVKRIDGKYHCHGRDGKGAGCPHSILYDQITNPCRHVIEADNRFLRMEMNYMKRRKTRGSHSYFKDFDGILHWFWLRDDLEFNYLSSIAMMLAASEGTVSADDIRECVGDEFDHEPAILGSVLGGLGMRKLLTKIGEVRVRIDTGRHRKYIGSWVLTELGKELMGVYDGGE